MNSLSTLSRKYTAIRFLFILFFFLVTRTSIVLASEMGNPETDTFEKVSYVRNFDGDSITFDIPDTPAIVGKNITVRLRGVDCPELNRYSCQAEKEKALQAKSLVETLLHNAKVIHLRQIGRGKYFRIVAAVEFDGKDLATVLLNNNLAIPYSGGTKEHNWCADFSQPPPIPKPKPLHTNLPPQINGVYIWPPPPEVSE